MNEILIEPIDYNGFTKAQLIRLLKDAYFQNRRLSHQYESVVAQNKDLQRELREIKRGAHDIQKSEYCHKMDESGD